MSFIYAAPVHLPATVIAGRGDLWSASWSMRRRLFVLLSGLLSLGQPGHAIVDVLRISSAKARRA